MNKLVEIVKKFPRAIKDPGRAAVLLWRRIFPFGITPKDPTAYRIGSWSYGELERVSLSKVYPGIKDVDVTILNTYERIIDMSLDVEEIVALCAIIKLVGARSIMEIGTYDGNTAMNIAANIAEDATLTTIDLPLDFKGQFAMNVPETFVNKSERKVGRQYINTKYSKKINQVYEDSAKLDWKTLPVPFDVVFIDGCHYYNYVKSDTENAMKHLKSNGILIWHDYGMIKDVSKVVDETSKMIKVNAIQGTRLAVGFMGQ